VSLFVAPGPPRPGGTAGPPSRSLLLVRGDRYARGIPTRRALHVPTCVLTTLDHPPRHKIAHPPTHHNCDCARACVHAATHAASTLAHAAQHAFAGFDPIGLRSHMYKWKCMRLRKQSTKNRITDNGGEPRNRTKATQQVCLEESLQTSRVHK
jgi:hypothetical protein